MTSTLRSKTAAQGSPAQLEKREIALVSQAGWRGFTKAAKIARSQYNNFPFNFALDITASDRQVAGPNAEKQYAVKQCSPPAPMSRQSLRTRIAALTPEDLPGSHDGRQRHVQFGRRLACADGVC